MAIKDRNLKPGTILEAKYHKQTYTCKVVEGEGGKLRYRLKDGREFKSPSAAGMAITGHACDGWVFWSMKTAETAPTPDTEQKESTELTTESVPTPEMLTDAAAGSTETDTSPATASATEPPVPVKKRPIFRAPNQKGVPTGKTRWLCHDCGQSFLADMGVLPKTCPQGHQAS